MGWSWCKFDVFTTSLSEKWIEMKPLDKRIDIFPYCMNLEKSRKKVRSFRSPCSRIPIDIQHLSQRGRLHNLPNESQMLMILFDSTSRKQSNIALNHFLNHRVAFSTPVCASLQNTITIHHRSACMITKQT